MASKSKMFSTAEANTNYTTSLSHIQIKKQETANVRTCFFALCIQTISAVGGRILDVETGTGHTKTNGAVCHDQ
jgi:hypothetical protein